VLAGAGLPPLLIASSVELGLVRHVGSSRGRKNVDTKLPRNGVCVLDLDLRLPFPISLSDRDSYLEITLSRFATTNPFSLPACQIAAMAAIPAPCARVERMRPAAQAGGPQAAEQRAMLPARPSGPAPVLGDAGRVRGVQSRRRRVLRSQAAWSSWSAAARCAASQ
jgi:hypothetical protein